MRSYISLSAPMTFASMITLGGLSLLFLLAVIGKLYVTLITLDILLGRGVGMGQVLFC